MKTNWHTISIPKSNFEELRQIQNLMPVRLSLSQTVGWLIKVGHKKINETQEGVRTNDSKKKQM